MTTPVAIATSPPVTRAELDAALDRLGNSLDVSMVERDTALERLIGQRLTEHERRLTDVNNAHDKAVEAKRLTDKAATEIAERAVKTTDLDDWKREVNKRLDLAAGAAKTWALVGAVGGSIAAGLIVALMSQFLSGAKP